MAVKRIKLDRRAMVVVAMLAAVCYSGLSDSHDGLDQWFSMNKYKRVKTMHRFMPGDVPTDNYGGFHMKADTCFGPGEPEVSHEKVEALPGYVTAELREDQRNTGINKHRTLYIVNVTRFSDVRMIYTTVKDLLVNIDYVQKRCPEIMKRWSLDRRRVVLGVIEAVEVKHTVEIEGVERAFRPTEAVMKKVLRFGLKVFIGDFLQVDEDNIGNIDGLPRVDNGLENLGDGDHGKTNLEVWNKSLYRYRVSQEPSIVEATIAVYDCWTRSVFRQKRCK